jgi:hypothetical protein
LLICFGPLFFLTVVPLLAIVLVSSGLIFLWFSGRVLAQCLQSITLTTDGLSSRGLRQTRLAWTGLTGFRLAYYASLRRRSAGWYQLILVGEGNALRLESTLEGFDLVLQSALDAARRADLALDPSTRDNLAAWADREHGVRRGDVDMMAA